MLFCFCKNFISLGVRKQNALIFFVLFLCFFLGSVESVSATEREYESTFESRLFNIYPYSSNYYGNVYFNYTLEADTSVRNFQMRAGDDEDTGDDSWTDWVDFSDGDSLSQFDGKAYLQYRVILGTDELGNTPSFENVSIDGVEPYKGRVISSVYDTTIEQGDSVRDFWWDQILPDDTELRIQLRTSPDNDTWTDWCGPEDGSYSTDSCDSDSYFTDPEEDEVPAQLADGVDDRYFQYKVYFDAGSTVTSTPVLESVSMEYDVPRDTYPRWYESTFESRLFNVYPYSPNYYGNVDFTYSVERNTSVRNFQMRAGNEENTSDASWTDWVDYRDIYLGLDFDGSSDYVSLSDNYATTPEFTFSAWVNIKDSVHGDTRGVFSIYNESSEDFLVMGYRDRNIRLWSSEFPDLWVDDEPLEQGQWYFFTWVFDGQEVKGYVDGELEEVRSIGENSGYIEGSLQFAREHRDAHFHGILDDLRIYDRALSAEEIVELSNKERYATTDGLVGHWPFENRPETTVPDTSGNDNHGTVHGASWDQTFDGKNYLQYRVTLGTDELGKTPALESVTIDGVEPYKGEVRSSPYDSRDAQTLWESFTWSEILEDDSEIRLQARTSRDGSTWTPWCGPDDGSTSGCDSGSFLTESGVDELDSMLTDAEDDRFFQWRAIFDAGDTVTSAPTLEDVDVQFDIDAESTFESRLLNVYPLSRNRFGHVYFNYTLEHNTSFRNFQMRAGDVTDTSDDSWTDWIDVVSGDYLPDLGINNKRYLQYRVTLGTDELGNTPALENVTVEDVEPYWGRVFSNVYDTRDQQAKFQYFSWLETLEEDTRIIFRTRSRPQDGDWTSWDLHENTPDNRYYQWYVRLISDGHISSVPTLEQVDLEYEIPPVDQPRDYESTFESRLLNVYPYAYNRYGDISINFTLEPNTSFGNFQMRAGRSADTSHDSWNDWDWRDVSDGDSLSQFDGSRYLQYRVTLGTDELGNTPALESVHIDNVEPYLGRVISSVYDTRDARTEFIGFDWVDDLPEDTRVVFRTRSSPDGSDWGAGWDVPDATQDDRYYQWLAWFWSDGHISRVPTLEEVNLEYDPPSLCAPREYESTYESRIFDLGESGSINLGLDYDIPPYTSIAVYLRTGNSSSPGSGWESWTKLPTQEEIAVPEELNNNRYAQYRLVLGTDELGVTPSVDKVEMIIFGGSLVSSPYDTTVTDNKMTGIEWIEDIPEDASVEMSVRTSDSDSFLLDSNQINSGWHSVAISEPGESISNAHCSKHSVSDGYRVICSESALPSDLRAERPENKYLQYRLSLSANPFDLGDLPTIYETGLEYEAMYPFVDSVSPDRFNNTEEVNITIEGSSFQEKDGEIPEVALINEIDGNEVEIWADTVIYQGYNELAATFEDVTLYAGSWDVVVKNPNQGRGSLEEGLTLVNSGIYTTEPYDLGGGSEFGSINFGLHEPDGTSITIEARSSNNEEDLVDPHDQGWEDGECEVENGTPFEEANCIDTGHQYVQFRFNFESELAENQPYVTSLDVEILASLASIISSPYDTVYEKNAITGFRWTEKELDVPNQRLEVYARAWSFEDSEFMVIDEYIEDDWYLVSETHHGGNPQGCEVVSTSGSERDVECSVEDVPEELRNIDEDQVIQYKINLVTPIEEEIDDPEYYDQDEHSPRFSNFEVLYTHNQPPEFDDDDLTAEQKDIEFSPEVYQGDVEVEISVRNDNYPLDDPDGTSSPLAVLIEYSLDDGETWSSPSPSHLQATSSDGEILANSEDELRILAYDTIFTDYTIYWRARDEIPGVYSTNTRIRMVLDDQEPVRNIATATSARFTLDTIAPVWGDDPINLENLEERSDERYDADVVINPGAESFVDGPYKVEESRIGYNMLDLDDGVWGDYSSSTPTTLQTRPDIVYAQLRDNWNNQSVIVGASSNRNIAGEARIVDLDEYIYTSCHDYGDCEPDNMHNVILDILTLNFSGYASSSQGWVSFESEETPPDDSFRDNCLYECNSTSTPACTACYNPEDNNVYGWAQLVSSGDWLELNGAEIGDVSNVRIGAMEGSTQFRGSAHSDDLGEVIFNCVDDGDIDCASNDYHVRLVDHFLPEAYDLKAPNQSTSTRTSDDGSLCHPDTSVRDITLEWAVRDESDDSYIRAFEVRIATTSNVDNYFATASDTRRLWDEDTASFSFNWEDSIDYKQSYYWWVRVYDTFGFNSGWVQFDHDEGEGHELTNNREENFYENAIDPYLTFTTYKHEFPNPYIYWEPHYGDDYPTQEQYTFLSATSSHIYADEDGSRATPVTFATSSYESLTWRAGVNPERVNFLGATSTPTTSARFLYSTSTIELEIEDLSGYTCATSTVFDVDVMPLWEEVKTSD